MYEYARSPLLLSLMRLLWASLHGGPKVTRTHEESARQHDEILAALRAGDPAAAAAGTYRHIMGRSVTTITSSTLTTDDGVSLHAESTGRGTPLLFLHEFAGDHRSWEPQVRFFSSSYRCVTYAARGYPPSGVPADPAAYSQERAVADAVAVLDGLGIPAAHVVGLSMGGFAALHLTLRHPGRVLSTVAAGAGYGAAPDRPGRVPRRVRGDRGGVRARRDPARSRRGTRWARPGCSSRTRTRVAGPSSRTRWPGTRRRAPR